MTLPTADPSPPPPWPTVVFDFDGTLADTIDLIVEGFQHATTEVLGFAEDRATIVAGIGRILEDRMADIAPERVPDLVAAYVPYLEAHLTSRVTAYPGIPELLRDLRAAGVRVGIATSRRRSQTEDALDALGLDHLIEAISGLEDTAAHKPSPEPVLRSLDLLGAVPGEAAYVGDAAVDIQAARAAGAAAVAVTWGAGPQAALAEGPDHVATTTAELREILLGGPRVDRPAEGLTGDLDHH